MKDNYLLLILILLSGAIFLGCDSKVYEETIQLLTYEYSDANPIPEFDSIYPYARFESCDKQGVMKDWNMVVLENRYIKLWIAPEIGGKVWGAIEKKSGKEFIYFNEVVKFVDGSSRGAWSSGGLEFHFGSSKKSLTSAAAVDYYYRENDGSDSVSCFVSSVDLITNTRWRVEYRLGEEESFFTTTATWENRGKFPQSHSNWMNLAIPSSKKFNSHFGGEQTHDISNEGFAFYLTGELINFFGGYSPVNDFGMGHYAFYEDRHETRVMRWEDRANLSQWETLITDTSGPYCEIQSGSQLIAVNPEEQNFSFRSRAFYPGQSYTFTEFWFPVVSTGGLTSATPDGVLFVEDISAGCKIVFSPNREFYDYINVFAGETKIFSAYIKAKTLEKEEFIIPTHFKIDELSFYLGNRLLYEGDRNKKRLNRGQEPSVDYDWNSSEALASVGREWYLQKSYDLAKKSFNKALASNPYNKAALLGLGQIVAEQFNYEEALSFSQKTLQIDGYDPEANLLYGVASQEMGNEADAIDGYSIASGNPLTSVAALASLVEIAIRKKDFEQAYQYAVKVKRAGGRTGEMVAMEAIILRFLNDEFNVDDDPYEDREIDIDSDSFLNRALKDDPLNLLLLAEKAIREKTDESYQAWINQMKSEFVYQSQLDTLFFYYNLGLIEDVKKLIHWTEANPFISLLDAFIYKKEGILLNNESLEELRVANSINPKGFFPFRQEMIAPLEWAITMNKDSWKFKWYLGLLYQNVGQLDKAEGLYDEALKLETIHFYPFYINYYSLPEKASALKENEADRILAMTEDWICDLELAKLLNKALNSKKALEILRNALQIHPENDILKREFDSITEGEG